MRNTYKRKIEFPEGFARVRNLKDLFQEVEVRFNVLGRGVGVHFLLDFPNGDGRKFDDFAEFVQDQRSASDVRDEHVDLFLIISGTGHHFDDLGVTFSRYRGECDLTLSASDLDGSFREDFLDIHACLKRFRARYDAPAKQKRPVRTGRRVAVVK